MAMRHIEVVVDKWPVGSRNEMLRKGERAFLDDKAAHILVGMGKAMYVDQEETQQRGNKRRYNRRDMRAAD